MKMYERNGRVAAVLDVSHPNIAPVSQHGIKAIGINGTRKNKQTIQLIIQVGIDENNPHAKEKAINCKNLISLIFI